WLVAKNKRGAASKTIAIFCLAGIAVLALAYVVPATGVAHRVDEALSDIQRYMRNQDATTSVGIRLELWKASWMMLSDHPWLGVGRDQFRPALLALAAQGRLPLSPALEFSSSHNDALHFLATGGLLDFSFLLLLYGAPLVFFARVWRQAQQQADHVRAEAALAGLVLVLCFIGFGLTDVMFWLMMTKVFYVMMVGVLAGFCLIDNSKQ
ncbi:MAG: O-antigen ligase family protein, partial [Burkholderiales bacterium]|nr:O-antigen ligase family protein [Burkholderiales bacterium]